jgi:SEC-C motif
VHDLLMVNLAGLCPTGEAFDLLYRMAREGDYDPRTTDLTEDVFAVATMIGASIPEYDRWRRHAEQEERRIRNSLERDGGFWGDDDQYRQRALHGPRPEERQKQADPDWDDAELAGEQDDWDTSDPVADLPEQVNRYMPPVTATIRREQPKVGRNDPCPCGSGKKYKKCCGNQ